MSDSKHSSANNGKRNGLILTSPWAWGIFGTLTLLVLYLWQANAHYAVTGELPFYLSFNEPAPPQTFWELFHQFKSHQSIASYSERGPIGDTFGIANSLFSGLALLGLFYAILLQHEELAHVKQERRETKVILDKQEENIEAHAALNAKQSFETSLYNALDLLLKHRGQLIFEGASQFSGKIALSEMAASLHKNGNTVENLIHSFDNYWSAPNNKVRSRGTSYIRAVMMICEIIEKTTLENKEFYRQILRSQLDEPDLVLILFAACSKNNISGKWLELVKSSNILKYITLQDWDNSCKRYVEELLDECDFIFLGKI